MDENPTFRYGIHCIWKRRVSTIENCISPESAIVDPIFSWWNSNISEYGCHGLFLSTRLFQWNFHFTRAHFLHNHYYASFKKIHRKSVTAYLMNIWKLHNLTIKQFDLSFKISIISLKLKYQIKDYKGTTFPW